jgi:hypothetical protein
MDRTTTSGRAAAPRLEADVVPICESGDYFAGTGKSCREASDLLALMARARTDSHLFQLQHASPAREILRGRRFKTIRRREVSRILPALNTKTAITNAACALTFGGVLRLTDAISDGESHGLFHDLRQSPLKRMASGVIAEDVRLVEAQGPGRVWSIAQQFRPGVRHSALVVVTDAEDRS